MNQKLQMTLMFIITVFSCAIAEGVNTTSQEDKPVNTRDALKGIIGDSNTPEEPSPKSLIDAVKGIIGDNNTPEEPNEVIEKIPKTGTLQSGKPLQKAGEEDSGTLYELGRIYLEGSGDIARDVTKALELLTKSAELGNGNAMLELAYIYQRGDGADRDPQKTLEWLHKAAEAGKGIAMLALANVVSEGQDPEINVEQRMEWVRKGLNSLEEASRKGDCDAMRVLGMIYQPVKTKDLGPVTDSITWFGMHLLREPCPGIDKDEVKSSEWYRKAASGYEKKAAAGDSGAMYWLGKMYELGLGVEKDVTKELHWYRKAAEAGHGGGMVELGWACYRTKDFENAFKWFNKATEQGGSEALMSLGWLYSKGHGIPQDKLKAVKLWRQAADRGHTIAMLSLGATYANGDGVNQDYPQAFTWYKKGADAGDRMCMFSLGLMYLAGRGIPDDPKKAVEWWTKGAEKEHDGCMVNLGWAYLNGNGVQKDRRRAVHWLQKASDFGNEYATKRLVELGEIR